jgi:hypothetical protein
MVDPTIESALQNVKMTALQVQRCPACQSDRIYTTLNVAYTYDHKNHTVNVKGIVNLAEHGWHGCFACNHRWVSNALLQTAVAPKNPAATNGKVIDLVKPIKKI